MIFYKKGIKLLMNLFIVCGIWWYVVCGDPLTTLDERTELVKSWKGTAKSLHTSLNLTIRLGKQTLTKVKADCLFEIIN